MKQWQLDAEVIEEYVTGTGKGGVILSKDLKEIIEIAKIAWASEVTDDEDEDDK